MPKPRKDEPADVRKDASGREMFPWEVDPADQVSRRPADLETETDGTGGGSDQPPGTGDSAA
jgi:hypothetical protein